jgi:myo-inositol-1(or 4)-monophosphatase
MSFWRRPIVQERKADGSPVSEADKAIEKLLAARLKDARPGYGWLSEESPDSAVRLCARRVWIADPIDGTREFLRGGNDWTVALALVEDGAPVLAAVTNPVRQEVFAAEAGKGATLNGEPIFVSGHKELAGARVSIGATSLKNGRLRQPWPGAVPVMAGSLIYRLALIACGRADVSFALNPKWEWDIAAGALLVSEAGGTITDATGAPLAFNSAEAKVKGFAAAPPELHGALLRHLS